MSRTNRDGSTLRNGKPRTYKSVYPSTQPSPATRNSPRETRNSGNQSTSSQPPSRATSGRKLPPNPIDLTGPTNEQQQQEENNNVLNTGLPSVLGTPLFIHIHNWTGNAVDQLQQVTSQIRTSLQSYLDQHYHGVSVVMDWLLPCCCSSSDSMSNKIYKFRLNGTQAMRVSQLLVNNTRHPAAIIGQHLSINSCGTCCRSDQRMSGDVSNSDKLIFSGIVVLSVVLVCLIVMVVISYQCYRKKARSQARTRQVLQVPNGITTRDYNRLTHTFNSQPVHTAAPDYYLPLQSPTRTTD
ncbi:uncharacterized protein [Dysidea avara]|uniref:uncharacterized protein isoform X2 n=1 Tax=Dysidea avara TaxID=196820 RepID=UPI00332F931B